MSLPLKGAAHGGLAGSSLTTIAGSTAALKWDPPLTQLSDWLSNYRPSIIILFFFFPGGGTWTWGWVCQQQQQPCHLTCVGAESLPVLSYPVPAGATQCLNPFCGSGRTYARDWYVKRNASMSASRTPLPFRTWILIYLGSYN